MLAVPSVHTLLSIWQESVVVVVVRARRGIDLGITASTEKSIIEMGAQMPVERHVCAAPAQPPRKPGGRTGASPAPSGMHRLEWRVQIGASAARDPCPLRHSD